MKKIIFTALLLGIGTMYGQEMPKIEKCYSKHFIEYMDQNNPGYETLVNKAFNTAKDGYLKTEETYIIPIVVHIVYDENHPEKNLADSVVFSQIEVLNEDFARLNADSVNLRNEFLPYTGRANIQFELASVDPEGNPTTGITRTVTEFETFVTDPMGLLTGDMSQMERVKSTGNGGIDPWDQSHYLNIWVCDMSINFMGTNMPGVLGYATPPSGVPTWPVGSIGGMSDGVVIQYQAFGRNNPNVIDMNGTPRANLGRTPTHEIGHYLGLRHIWGDGDCSQEDGIDDTPNATSESQGCPTQNNTCVDDIDGVDLPDMIENFMDYSDEDCQNTFTKGQVAMMRAVLEHFRWELIGLDGPMDWDLSVDEEVLETNISPNPTNSLLNITSTNVKINAISIYGINGQLVVNNGNVNSNEITLNVAQLEQGIYLVKMQDINGNVAVEKFVKE